MTSNPTSEGLVERLNIAERRWFITSAQQQLLSDAADRIEALEAQLEGAKEALGRWATARKVALTLTDKLPSDDFKRAWHELGEAEWALVRLAASTLYGLEGDQEVSPSQSQPCGDGAQPILPPGSEPSAASDPSTGGGA